jgi:hypothetical protein
MKLITKIVIEFPYNKIKPIYVYNVDAIFQRNNLIFEIKKENKNSNELSKIIKDNIFIEDVKMLKIDLSSEFIKEFVYEGYCRWGDNSVKNYVKCEIKITIQANHE